MRTFSIFLVLALLAGCAPEIRPLYYDYEPPRSQPDSSFAGVQGALRDAGWQLARSEQPGTVNTRERTVQNWGLYRIVVSLEAAPMSNGEYVRLFVHPYRDYIIGGKSKLAYLPSGLRDDLIPTLNEAFRARNLTPVGTPYTRGDFER